MGLWDAPSDRDWYDECYGPYPETVERTCTNCQRRFAMLVEGDYVMHPWCDRCRVDQDARNEFAKREQEQDRPIKRGAA